MPNVVSGPNRLSAESTYFSKNTVGGFVTQFVVRGGMQMRSAMFLSAVVLGLMVLARPVLAQPPVPSSWEGEASGTIHGVEFRVPITVEFRQAIAHEDNPFNLYIGSASTMAQIGDVLVVSATAVNSSGGGGTVWIPGGNIGIYQKRLAPHSGNRPLPGSAATLQYWNVRWDGQGVTAVLTDTNAAAAATLNGFTGPNVSAQEASPLMRGVMESLGSTENFVFRQGAVVKILFGGDGLSGSLEGTGRSVTNTSSDVRYACSFRARRTP